MICIMACGIDTSSSDVLISRKLSVS